MTLNSKFAALCIATSTLTAAPAFAVATAAPTAHVSKPAAPHVVPAPKPAAPHVAAVKPAAHPVAAAKPATTPHVAAVKPTGGFFGTKPAVAPRTTAHATNGRMVRARLANGQIVTYNCSLAGNLTKTACKR